MMKLSLTLVAALLFLPGCLAAATRRPPPLTFATEGGTLGRVMALELLGDRMVAGTDTGLYQRDPEGQWSELPGSKELPHQGILSLAADPATGDLWVGTLRGLARISAGRTDVWSQFSSGLANDVVYGLAIQDRFVWAATAAGLSRFEPATGRWWIFNEKNTPMRETWNYSVAVAPDRVWVGIWGSGMLEYYITDDRWKLYLDPDGEMEVVVMRNAGPIHDVTSAVATDGNVVWQSTYFGLSRYDGRRWKNYLAEDGGLPSNFVTTIKTKQHRVWACTDLGLASFDGRSWDRYLEGIPILSVGFQGRQVFAGTYEGIRVGTPAPVGTLSPRRSK